MQYIPNSKLRENDTAVQDILDTVSKKYLNRDVVSIITSFHNPYMVPDTAGIDRFWLNLGCEVYNLKRWSWYCEGILQRPFGYSSKYCKYVNFEDDLDNLRGHLDTIVSNSYPGNQHMIDNVAITDVFYNNETITKYPIRYVCEKRKITADEKEYILVFLSRLNECLDFLINNLSKIGTRTKDCSDARKEILKIVKNIKKRLSKHNIISEIEM